MSIYSQIYSCKSKNFESKNKYTMERIKRAEELVGDNFIGVFDRGYDDNKIIHYMSRHKFVIRLDDKRNLIFKGKRHSVEEIDQGRKGKIKMKALFDEKEKYEVINNVPKNEEPTDPESTNKKAMADLFKKYAQKVDDYIQVGKYYCVVGELLRPTRFVIEIDTSIGESAAQQNGHLIQEDSTKSPWDNKDIKGYIIVENQLMEDNKYHVFLSDGYYGLSTETERRKITQGNIVLDSEEIIDLNRITGILKTPIL